MHHSLLQNRFAPTTFCIGLLESPLGEVVAADQRWRDSIGGYETRQVHGTLDQQLTQLAPLSGPLLRHLWIETDSPWTAYFDNFINGSDPWHPISSLSKLLRCRGLLLSCRPEIQDRSFGQCRFDLYGQAPVGIHNQTRSIAATNDGGRWSWDASGDPLPFEQVDLYSLTRVRDRLTPEIVAQYAQALNAEPYDHEFYRENGYIVENANIDPLRCRTETYTEAHRRIGISSDA